jgi:hypothetical protein
MRSFQRTCLTAILAVLTIAALLALLRPLKAAPLPNPLLAPSNPVTNPARNTHIAPITTTVSIMYDENINPATVFTQTFAIHAMQTGLLTQTYSVSGGSISLLPIMPFKPGEMVQVSATTGTLSLVDGAGPISPTVWQFSTAVDDGSGIFTDSEQSLVNSPCSVVSLGDFNGDGALDAFIGCEGANQVWLNDGAGIFTDSDQRLGDGATSSVALGDVDGDGDLDAVVGNTFSFYGHSITDTVWLNDGTGIFTDSGQSLSNRETCDIALGDVDGDGDLDAFVGIGHYPGPYQGYPNQVWLNDGTGVFTDSGQRLGNSTAMAVALADVDGDWDLDAVVGNYILGLSETNANEIWLNDGSGSFTDSGQRLGNSQTTSIAVGDLNGDSYPDFIDGNGGPDQVWLNDGTGIFTDSGQSLGGADTSSHSVALGDVDGDVDLDVFGGGVFSTRIWLNDGAGIFTDSGQNLGNSSSWGVAIGDLNGDGDLDAFFVKEYGYGQVWVNLNIVYLPIILN